MIENFYEKLENSIKQLAESLDLKCEISPMQEHTYRISQFESNSESYIKIVFVPNWLSGTDATKYTYLIYPHQLKDLMENDAAEPALLSYLERTLRGIFSVKAETMLQKVYGELE